MTEKAENKEKINNNKYTIKFTQTQLLVYKNSTATTTRMQDINIFM